MFLVPFSFESSIQAGLYSSTCAAPTKGAPFQSTPFLLGKHVAFFQSGFKDVAHRILAQSAHQGKSRQDGYTGFKTWGRGIWSGPSLSLNFCGQWWTETWNSCQFRLCITLCWHSNRSMCRWRGSAGRLNAVNISLIQHWLWNILVTHDKQ